MAVEAKIRLAVEGAALAKGEMDRVAAGLSGVTGAAGIARTALAGLGGVVTVGAFLGLIRGSIDAADRLNDLSKSTNIAVGDLAGLSLLAKQSGTDLDGLAKGINKMSVEMGKSPEKFRALGITAKDNTGALKQFSDLFNQLPDIQQRNALAQAVFSKSWQELAPTLALGGDEIGKIIDKGREMSNMNQALASSADEFNDKWQELVGTGGFMNNQLSTLLPLLTTLLSDFVELRDKSSSAGEGVGFLTTGLQAIVVTGGNVAFTLRGVFNELSGISAQINAIKLGEFGLAASIGEKMRADAEKARKEFDAWENKIMTAGNRDLRRGSDDPRIIKPAGDAGASARASKFLAGNDKKGTADKISEYQRLTQEINKVIAAQDAELAMGGKLAASDKFRMEEQQKLTFAFATGKISAKERIALLELTATAADKMYEAEKRAYEFEAIQKNNASAAKEYDAMRGTVDALIESNNQQRLENELIGLTATQIDALTLKRLDQAISIKEIALITAQSNGASAEAIALLEREIALLQQKRDLTGEGQVKKEVSLELKGFDATAAQFESLANITGKMGDGFGKATKALQGFSSAFKTLSAAEKNEKLSTEERTQATVGGYAEMAGAAKNFFEEGTAGYEILSMAEQAFRAVQLAMSIQAMAQDAANTASTVANDAATTASGMAAGGAKMFAQSGWGGFAGVAAMIAVMAGLGAMSSGGGGGGGAGGAGRFGAGAGAGNNGTFNESGYELKDNGRVATRRPSDQGSGAEGSRTQSEQDAYDEWVRTEEAADKAYTALRAANSELSTFEQRLVDVKKSIQGTGRDIYDESTKGMTEAERASYDYNASLTMQANVLVDLANGTKNTSDNMRRLAQESEQLAIDLMEASGDIAGARYQQMLVDTRGYSAEEIAVYNHNQAMRDQIAAAQAGASAAREAEQAERDLAQTRYELAGRLNILLGRQTQIEFDRATEMTNTTDAAAMNMLKLIYGLEDINTLIDKNFATLERSVAAEKEVATLRLNSAKELQTILKTAIAATTQELSRTAAQGQLQTMLAAAKASGVLPTADVLKPVMTALGKPSTDLFTNFVDYQRDFVRTANDIRDMAELADEQVSTEQQTIDALNGTLEAAKAQIDALRGVDNSVKDVSTAVNEVTAAIKSLTDLQASSPLFTYGMPATASGGGGGGYYGGGYGGDGGSASAFETIAGQDNKDIVAAYRTYFNRNPDEGGYNSNLNSGLKGDALMKSILRGAQGGDFEMAVSRGWDPRNADSKFLKSILFPGGSSSSGGGSSSDPYYGGGLAVGANQIPYDLVTKLHKDERVIPPADNRELMARLREPSQNNAALVAEVRALRSSNEALTAEVQGLRAETRAGVVHASKTASILDRVTIASGGESMSVEVKA